MVFKILSKSFFIVLAFSLFNCECPISRYDFKFETGIDIKSDSVFLGDTIVLSIAVSDQFKDDIGQIIDYSNGEIEVGFAMAKIGNNNTKFPASDMEIIVLKGQLIEEKGGQKTYKTEYSNSMYKLKLALIPKSKGIYYIQGLYSRRGGIIVGKTECESSASITPIISNKSNNHYLAKAANLNIADNRGSFYFVVK